MKLPTLPSIAALTSGAKLAGILALAAVALIGAAAVVGFVSDPFGWRKHQVEHAQQIAVQASGAAIVAGGQSHAAQDVQAVQGRATARDAAIQHTREKNLEAILAAPGAQQPLDPALVDAARRGLCGYDAYAADPDCLGLRPADPAVVPKPGRRRPAS